MRYAWRRAFKPFDQTTKTKPCAVCDRSFVGQASKYCSDGCRKEIARRKSRFYVLRKRSVSARECVVCGVEFTPEYQPWSGPRKMLVACSGACDAVRVRRSKRDMKAKRRARKRTATVETVRRAKIFERDGWRCRLCGKVVARNKVVPHPRAPVLDHIIPLARGGTHEGRNVHTAHFICNSLKGDRAVGEQLLLVG
jgi:5-methylcytosine-specific restriction endonuclease McrA